mgnify:FL=1
MPRYQASQNFDVETPMGSCVIHTGIMLYPVSNSLRELAERIEQTHNMRRHRDHVFDPEISVSVGLRNPRPLGDYELRDGRLHKVPSHV